MFVREPDAATQTERLTLVDALQTHNQGHKLEHMTPSSRIGQKGATKFAVKSHEEHNRNYQLLIALVAVIVGTLWHIDPNIHHDVLWILGGLGVGLALLETAPAKSHVELIIDIGPLGIQRTTKRNGRSTHHPLLPRECVQDCIITEHVGAFGVSNHLVFRVESKLIPVFPNAKLSFAQCQSLLQQVQTALREV